MLVDLSLLPAPNVIEPLSYEAILARNIASLQKILPDWQPLESDMYMPYLEESSYRELMLRQRVNGGAKSVMLAYAVGADLDQIGVNYGVVRHTLQAADNAAIPPLAAIMESDSALRERIRLAMYVRTTAGAANQYKYYALSAHADVLDVSITSPNPGEVLISILSHIGSGVAGQAVLDAVQAACNADDVRPLTDFVHAQSANIIDYTVSVAVTMYPGFDPITVQQAAYNQINTYCERHHALGHDITRAGIIAAASVEGVQNVSVASPATDLVMDDISASHLTNLTVSMAGSAI